MKAKKILATIMFAVLTLSTLSACSNSQPSSSSEQSKESSSSTSSSAESSEEEGGYKDGDIEVSAPGEFPIISADDTEKATISVFTAISPGVSSEYDSSVNSFSKWYEEKTNVHVDWSTTTQADFTSKLNIFFLSDNYEDVVLSTWWDSAAQYSYGEQGLIIPLDEYIDEHGYYLNKFLEAGYETGTFTPTDVSALTMLDGHVYSLGSFQTSANNYYVSKMWIYTPWLDAVNMEMPTTTSEFYDVLTAFKTQDPNGNGKNDEIPLVGAKSGWCCNPIEFLMNSFTYYQMQTKMNAVDGEIVYVPATDEYKAGLEYMNSLVENGLLSGDSFVQDINALKALASSETHIVGATCGGYYSTVIQIDDEGDWMNWEPLLPLEGPEGVQYAKKNSSIPGVRFNITDKCDYPLVAFKLFDGLYEPEISLNSFCGMKGEHWDYAEEGELGLNGEQGTIKFLTNLRDQSVAANYQNITWPGSIAGTFPGWQEGQVESEGQMEDGMNYKASNAYAAFAPEDSLILPSLMFEGDSAEEYIDISFTLNEYVTSETVEFILNGGIDEGWDTYLKDLEDRQLSDLVSLAQGAYDSRMASMKD